MTPVAKTRCDCGCEETEEISNDQDSFAYVETLKCKMCGKIWTNVYYFNHTEEIEVKDEPAN